MSASSGSKSPIWNDAELQIANSKLAGSSSCDQKFCTSSEQGDNSKDMPPVDNDASARFTLFPKLPLGLRRIVWKHAIPGPRLVRYPQILYTHYCLPEVCTVTNAGIPAIVLTRREALTEVNFHFTKIMVETRDTNIYPRHYQGGHRNEDMSSLGIYLNQTPYFFYFNHHLDTLYLHHWYGDMPFKEMSDLIDSSTSPLKKIKRLALDIEVEDMIQTSEGLRYLPLKHFGGPLFPTLKHFYMVNNHESYQTYVSDITTSQDGMLLPIDLKKPCSFEWTMGPYETEWHHFTEDEILSNIEHHGEISIEIGKAKSRAYEIDELVMKLPEQAKLKVSMAYLALKKPDSSQWYLQYWSNYGLEDNFDH